MLIAKAIVRESVCCSLHKKQIKVSSKTSLENLQQQKSYSDPSFSALKNSSDYPQDQEVKIHLTTPASAGRLLKLPELAILPDYMNFFAHLSWELSNKQKFSSLAHGNIGIGLNKCGIQLENQFKDDPDIFYPKCNFRVDHDQTALISALSQAFAEGKKIAAFRISDNKHCECAAFDHKGNFVILAEWSGLHTVSNLSTFTKALNQAGMKDAKGRVIEFKGKYIDTGLQLGGHHCLKFAELYRYQIAKEKNLDAYKKVNGAFYNQQLKIFEDIEKITHAPELTVMPAPNSKNNWEKTQYKFLISMAARTYGVKQNSWEEVTIKDILPNLSWENQYHKVPINSCCFELHDQVLTYFMIYSAENVSLKEKIYVSDTTPFRDLFHDQTLSLMIERDGNHFLVKKDKVKRNIPE